jgi:predicted DNA-binding transcriptional regulator AlpA
MAEATTATLLGASAPTYLDAAATAGRYRISVRHLYRMIDKKEFPAPRRLGRLNRWAVADLLRWEERGRQ